jgi:hypothetical protein
LPMGRGKNILNENEDQVCQPEIITGSLSKAPSLAANRPKGVTGLRIGGM